MQESGMKSRIAMWTVAGFLIASGWAMYTLASTPPALSSGDPLLPLVRFTCPIAILGASHAISLTWVLVANAATYALAGLLVEALRLRLQPAK
jgi:hypothetical protein